ncbi:MAG: FeoB-associated Cys-rich membrane protein [Clostridiales bacterium]|nr:FeoB-associated Cys-rich membrane protein [Clostridiales bacterium]
MIGNILVIALVVGYVAFVLRYLYRQKKTGNSGCLGCSSAGCGGSCQSCGGCSASRNRAETLKH